MGLEGWCNIIPTDGLGLDNGFAQPFSVYGVVAVIGYSPHITFVENIDIVFVRCQRYVFTREAVGYCGLPCRPSIRLNVFS